MMQRFRHHLRVVQVARLCLGGKGLLARDSGSAGVLTRIRYIS